MKFIYFLTSALLAASAQAQPIEEKLSLVEAQSLQKRDNVEFLILPSHDCSGEGVPFFLTGSGEKGNFGSPQFSVIVTKLSPGFHLTLYGGLDQSGNENQIFESSVGECLTPNVGVGVGWFSFGLFT